MRILTLGGTKFVGRAFVEAALERGHEVTLVHRGRTRAPEHWRVNEVLADRNGGLGALSSGDWDAVYDSCGYVPREVRSSLDALGNRIGRYLFVSSISVFNRDMTLARPTSPLQSEEITDETYGPLKVECEDAVRETLGSRAVIVRPGLVYGPYDPTNRFPYWVDRFDRYEEVLVPNIDGPLQLIDARDLGDFCVTLLEDDRSGIFPVTGDQIGFQAMIEACAAVGGGKPVRASEDALKREGIELGVDLPLVFEPGERLMHIDSAESLVAGLERRPLLETTKDTRSWIRSLIPALAHDSALSREREEAFLHPMARQ